MKEPNRPRKNEIKAYKIYALENNNNIIYVGKSSNPYHRLYSHKKTYGDNIELIIIDEVEDWKFWEKYWIEQFKQWGFNLKNKNKGGGGPDKGRKIRSKDDIWKSKLSNSHKGKKLSDETKNKMSVKAKGKHKSLEHISRIKKGQNNMSKEDKLKWGSNISKSKTGSKYNLSEETKKKLSLIRSKPVIQYNKSGDFIKIWENSKKASIELNINIGSIWNCCTGRSKTAGNSIFKYKQNENI